MLYFLYRFVADVRIVEKTLDVLFYVYIIALVFILFIEVFFFLMDAILYLLKPYVLSILTYRLQMSQHFPKVILEICDLPPRQLM